MDQAEKFYLKSDEPILCLSMYIRYNKWDKAEQLVKKYLQTEYHKQLISQEAENFEKNGRLKEAEKLYLLAEDYDVAITMYMENKQYDNMLRLVGIHRPDYLQDTHLKVANLICAETNANLKQAELHFIEANAWSECFDMYKNHDLWEDALRIAKSHGGREEVNAKAKEIVKDLPPLKQKETLLQMGMIDALIDIEIANNNFDEAKKLAKQHAKYKLPDVHYKYAIVLEDERRYHESELEFIEAGQPMEAIKMYEYIFDFMSALRVARQHSPENILPIFLNQGKYMLEKKDFKKAEFCFVSGKKPDIMAAYYLKEKMIAEGEEFCRKHYPIMLPEFCRTDEVDPDALNGDQLLKMVKNKLQTYDYHGAADLLLRANKSHFSDTDKLSEEWEKAIHIVSEYERNRYSEVLIIVAQKQRDLGLFKKAAEKFKSEGYWEDAVYCYMEVDMFNQCYEIISKLPEGQLKVKLNKLVSEEHKKKRGDIGPEGLELLFHQRQYEKCLEAAMKLSDEMFNKYLFKIVEAYIIDKSYIGAADLLERYETPINKNNLNWYKELSEEILAEENIDELKSLKNMLNCCLKHLVNYQEFANEMKYLARLHKISYYQYLKANMKNNQNFNYSYYHLSIGVLSYGDIIKFDQALYDAGTFARDQGQKGIAFILLDRYLDIYEIINDPQSKLEFKKEFDKTDIPQSDPFIGQQNILSNEEKEKLQTWIVKTSVDKNIDFTFPQKDCAKCKKKIFEYNTSCHHCGYQYDQCIITGYPINTQSDTIKCSNCNKKALKEAWKEWISNKERCPWCDSIQISYK